MSCRRGALEINDCDIGTPVANVSALGKQDLCQLIELPLQ